MPIIKEISSLEKIALMYYGRSKTQVLERTSYSSQPSQLRVNTSVNNYFKYKQLQPEDNSKFRSNKHLFCLKFNSSFPDDSLDMKTIYINRESQRTAFSPQKISRKDLEKILKWGIFYNEKNKRFTVPCGGALYHYEIYLCLFRSHLLPLGLYRYNPQTYTLALIRQGNYLEEAMSALNCYFDRLKSSTGVIFLASNLSESRTKYKHLSERLVLLDTGHIMHSLNLSLTASGYGVSNIGGGINKKIVKFLCETKKLNYIASIFFGGK